MKLKIFSHSLKFRRKHRQSDTIYLAVPYKEHERNQKLYETLTNAGFHIFLPENMHLKESTDQYDQAKVFHSCYYKLSKCGIILAVYPFGSSVSAEIGYAIAKNKILIGLKPKNVSVVKPECMINPRFHFIVESEGELMQLLKNLLGMSQ